MLLELHDASGATRLERMRRRRGAQLFERDDRHRVDRRSRSGSRRGCSAGRSTIPARCTQLLERDFRGHNMAKAAVEMGMWALAATMAGEPLARFIGGTRAEIATGISLGHPGEPRGADRQGARGARAGLPQGEDQDRAGPRRRVDRGRARRARPGAHLMADANNAYTLDDMDRLVALDGVRPHDDRAAARARRHRAARRTAEAAQDADLPRRIDHRPRQGAGHGRARQRAHREHQGRPRRRVHAVDRDPRFLPGTRRAGLVRRHARERRRPRVQRGDRVAAEFHPARRRESERALLGARHRDAGMDDGPRDGARAARPAGHRRGRGRGARSPRSRCARRNFAP